MFLPRDVLRTFTEVNIYKQLGIVCLNAVASDRFLKETGYEGLSNVHPDSFWKEAL